MKRFTRDFFIERYGEDAVNGVNPKCRSLSKILEDETYGLRAYTIDKQALFLLWALVSSLRVVFISYGVPDRLNEMREVFPEYFEIAEKKFEEISLLLTDITEYHTSQRKGLEIYTIAGLSLKDCLSKLRFIDDTYIVNRSDIINTDNTVIGIEHFLGYCERATVDLIGRFE